METKFGSSPFDKRLILTAQCIGAILDTVKPSEDGKRIIYRMYEGYNKQTTVYLHVPYDIQGRREYRTDLLESPIQKRLHIDEQNISFTIQPVKTQAIKKQLTQPPNTVTL